MNDRRGPSLTRGVRAILLCLAAGGLAPAAGATRDAAGSAHRSESQPGSREAGSIAPASPRERLEAMRERQRLAPVEGVMHSPEPAGLAESVAPLPEASAPGAGDALDDVMDRFAAMSIDPPAVPPPAEASGENRFLAARLYVQARSKMLDADAAGASADLEHAVTLDPGAATLWLALGEARLRSGHDAECVDAMRRATALGLEDPRALQMIAAWEVVRGEHDAAVHHAVRAVRALDRRDDPGVSYMAWASLGDALQGAGLLRASAHARVRAFDLPAHFPGGTAYPTELSAMYRGSWDALFQAARAALAVEDWECVARALDLATRYRSVDDGRLLPPRVLAALRMGQPADAALAILDAVEERAGATDPRTLRMIRHMRDHTDLGPPLAAALTESDARLHARSAAIDVAMARAIAAGLPDGLDRGPLFDALRRHPWDIETARDLFRSFGADELDRGADAAIALAGEHPAFADTTLDAMVAEGVRTPAVLERLRRRLDQPGAPLLLARLLMRQGSFVSAGEVLDQTEPPADDQAVTDLAASRWLCRVTLLAMAGDERGARRVIESWPTPATDAQRLCLVRAFAAVGDAAGAREAAGEPTGRTMEAARPAGQSGTASDTVLAGATSADNAASGAGGGAEDGARLEEPESRDPSSDAARALLLQACQLARAMGDGAAAERMAIRLVRVDPYAEAGYGLLIGLYSPGGPRADQPKLQEVVQALRERLPTGALLRFLSAREFMQFGRLEEADARLRALAIDAPDDEGIARALLEVWAQRAARDGSFVLDEGEALLARIRSEHPAALVPALSAAQLAISRDRPAEAIGPIGAWLDQGLVILSEDRVQLRGVVEPLMRRATSGTDTRAREALLAMWDRLAGAGVPLDPPMHQARIVLLTQNPPFEDDKVLAAVTLAAEQVPAMSPGAFLAPVGRVVQGGRPDLGLRLLREGAGEGRAYTAQDTVRWAGLIAQFGTPDDLRDLLARTTDPATLSAMLPQLPAAPDAAPTDPARLRGDIAYALAAATRILDRPAEINEGFLAMALEECPDHESAANDLGYQWAERGVRLDEAEGLLLMAHHKQPDEANVLDSLGWLRYKQGRLADVVDGAGQVMPDGEGAITLLERAAALLPESAGPVTLDQLGDALWRAGRREDALARWRDALPRAEADVERLSTDQAPQGLRDEAIARRDAIARKILAGESGQDPPIAALGEGVTEIRSP